METVSVGGTEIPAIGFGTFQLNGEECRQAVKAALEAGYRHVDTAEYYDNEAVIGTAIAESAIDRDELFLTTKVWRSNLRYDDAIAAAEASLDRLDVEYVDLLLVHWPHRRIPVEETLEAMDELVDRGLARNIGVSNFTRAQLEEAASIATSSILTNQVLYHPYHNRRNHREYCTENETALTAYSPLARGSVLGDETLEKIGQRYGKTAPQVALRWLIQQPNVVALPRSSTPEHIEANLDIFDFELTDDEMARIADLSGGLYIRILNRLPALMRANPF